MKFFSYSHMSLLILGLFSIIKTGVAIKCYGTDNCELSTDRYKMYTCWSAASKKANFYWGHQVDCPHGVCTNVTLEHVGEKMVFKTCGDWDYCDLKIFKFYWAVLCRALSGIQVDTFHGCNTCTTDYCNGLPWSLHPKRGNVSVSEPKSTSKPKSKPKNNMATSTTPVTFGILIFGLLVHFLR